MLLFWMNYQSRDKYVTAKDADGYGMCDDVIPGN